MSIQSATATLNSEFSVLPITGFIEYKQGFLDPATNTIKALGNSNWSALSGRTWSSWTEYTLTPLPILWTADLVDLGEVRYFTLSVTAEYEGSIEYIIHTSETGEFQGEEKETYIAQEGDIPAFYGRYFYVTVRVSGRQLIALDFESSNATVTVELRNVKTSELSGTVQARTLTLPNPVSFISDIKMSVVASDPYILDVYVTDTPMSRALVPVVISKGATSAEIALFGLDNQPRDGVVDITVSAMPRQVLIGGSIFVIN